MDTTRERRRALRTLLPLLAAAVALYFAAHAGVWLVVDRPQVADVIVVLAGETEVRPEKALTLLRQGLATRVLLDVPTASAYGTSYQQLAEKWRGQLPTEDAARIDFCPIAGLSTLAEAREVHYCLLDSPHAVATRLLVVTSDYHTRRAGEIFRREFLSHVEKSQNSERIRQVSTAAAVDSKDFGAAWWQRRQWAKTTFSEWFRWLWWEAVDRW